MQDVHMSRPPPPIEQCIMIACQPQVPLDEEGRYCLRSTERSPYLRGAAKKKSQFHAQPFSRNNASTAQRHQANVVIGQWARMQEKGKNSTVHGE